MVGVDEPDELRRRVLAVIAAGADPTELGFELAQAQRRPIRPAALDLAAEVRRWRHAGGALGSTGGDVHLADRPVRGNAARQKRRYALNAAVLIAAGRRGPVAPRRSPVPRLGRPEAFIRRRRSRGSTVADICAALAARS
ncbi:MAG: hypothetical protein R2755_01810 [Acidimicrobiales bacterium]